MLRTFDSAAIDSFGVYHGYVRVDHNVIYNVRGSSNFGIYFDFSGGGIVDHNLIYNVSRPINTNWNPASGNQNMWILNNVAVSDRSTDTGLDSNSTASGGSIIRNNIFSGAIYTPTGATVSNNLVASNTLFVDPTNANMALRNYQLKSTATTAIDQGVSVAPYDDPLADGPDADATAQPDIGAYEFNTTPWKAGATDVVAPRVLGLWLGSSEWTSAAFLTAAGSSDGYAVPTGSSQQLAHLPWTNLNRVSVRFSEPVTVAQGQLAIAGVNRTTIATSGFSYDAATFTATWTLATALTADRLRLTVADGVTDAAGNALDGDWTDGASSFAPLAGGSGNGVAGGAFRFRLNVLPGDANRSGSVNANDSNAVRSAWGAIAGGGGAYSIFLDVNGSGSVNANDSNAVRSRWGNVLPTEDPI